MKLDAKHISIIRDYFRQKPVIKAYLFGSFAGDDASEDSDVDILVELDYSKPLGLEFIGMQLDLEDLLKRKVDLVSTNALSKYLRPYVDQGKILIYAR